MFQSKTKARHRLRVTRATFFSLPNGFLSNDERGIDCHFGFCPTPICFILFLGIAPLPINEPGKYCRLINVCHCFRLSRPYSTFFVEASSVSPSSSACFEGTHTLRSVCVLRVYKFYYRTRGQTRFFCHRHHINLRPLQLQVSSLCLQAFQESHNAYFTQLSSLRFKILVACFLATFSSLPATTATMVRWLRALRPQQAVVQPEVPHHHKTLAVEPKNRWCTGTTVLCPPPQPVVTNMLALAQTLSETCLRSTPPRRLTRCISSLPSWTVW